MDSCAACVERALVALLTAMHLLCFSCPLAATATGGGAAEAGGADELFFDSVDDEPAIFVGIEERLRPEAVRAAIVTFLSYRGLSTEAITQAHVEAVRVPEGRAMVTLVQCRSAAATALVL